MIMIQDDPMPTGSDKPLRITGDPYKVQVCVCLTVIQSQIHTHVMCRLRQISDWISVCVCSLQQARELVVEIIREKDQGDFRSGRSDFGSRLGSSIDVRARSAPASFRAEMKPHRPRVYCWFTHAGGSAQIRSGNRHRQKRRDDQEDSERCRSQDPVQARSVFTNSKFFLFKTLPDYIFKLHMIHSLKNLHSFLLFNAKILPNSDNF